MASPDFAGSENSLEVLQEFLHNMKRTVERLYAGHTLAARQTLKHGSSDNVQNSYDFGMLSTLSKGFSQPSQNALPDGVGKPGFFSQTTNSSQGVSKHVVTGKTNLNVCSSEMDIGNALSVFLEDMRKTIEAWSNRYSLLLEGKTSLMKDGLAVEALPQPLDSNQGIDQLDFGPNADRDFAAMEMLDLPYAETLQGSAQSRNGRTQRTQGNQGRKGRKAHFPGSQNKLDPTSFSLQDFNEVMGSQASLHDQDSRLQSLVGPQDCAENDCGANHGQIDMEQPGYDSADHGNLRIDEDSRDDRQGAENSIVLRRENGGSKTGQRKRKSKKKAPLTPVNSQELTIRHFQYKVEVVESPDWLPKGWITELKTRSTGGSAGSKDKYYFDPVSNRRCRSQKEVFSLLETGKLGRYKRKTKAQPAKKSGTEASPTLKMSDVAEPSSPNVFGERPSALPHQVSPENTADNVATPLAAISPDAGQLGVVNNMFVPYRPGQPSDWLVYESLQSMPRPVLENLRFTNPNSSKPNGERGSTPWPWFLNNSESSMRPFVDRFEVGKTAVMGGREDVLGNGQFNARESHFTEFAATRARKPSKRAALA